MKSSPIIALFGDPPPLRRGPSAFLISLALHACGFGLLLAGLRQPRQIDARSDVQRFTVRIMEFHQPEIPEVKERRVVADAVASPGKQVTLHSTEDGGAPNPVAAASIPLNVLAPKVTHQMLLQPEVAHDIRIPPEVALPRIVEWSPPIPTIRIVLPPPQPVAEIKVLPTLDTPNQEMRIADVKISSSAFDTKAPLPAPSKTSPVNVQTAGAVQRVPETATKEFGHVTPASIISLSETRLQDGAAALPMISEVTQAPFAGSLSAGKLTGLSQSGSGKADGKLSGSSTGAASGDQAGKTGAGNGNEMQRGTIGSPGGVAGLDSDAGQRAVVHINMPRDGKFGVVVVGSSPADEYAEAGDVWRGRLAYTVYLHVGATRNWIMQYSLPRAEVVDATGTAGRPDAPWPYDITRPSIDPDANAEAIMIHGFVNSLGRFERLRILFPAELAETKFLLHTLQLWQFRPAMQNGRATPVEVLLIIPDGTQ